MSNLLITLALFFLSAFTVFPQDSDISAKRRELTEKTVTLLQQGKLDDAIEAGEKLVKLEKFVNSNDTVSYTNALLNLARMKRDVFLIIKNRFERHVIDVREMQPASTKAQENAKAADALYRQTLQLNEQGGRNETAQTADIKGELGWLLYNYLGSRQSVDDSERLFLESISLNEKVRGKDADETLFIVLKTGDFYKEMCNFEKALPFYERYIQTNEKTHGKNYINLVNALQPTAEIMFATFQEQEAGEIIKRIAGLTKKSVEPLKADLRLHLRSKESVAVNTKASNDFRNSYVFYKAMRDYSTISRSLAPTIEIIPVNVVVDENGKIIEATATPRVKDNKSKAKAEQEVLKWNVRPFIYNGTPRKLRGILYYRESG